MLYNTDLVLWQNFWKTRQQLPNGGAILMIVDGHVSDGMQILARFADDSAALKVLTDAGFKQVSKNCFK